MFLFFECFLTDCTCFRTIDLGFYHLYKSLCKDYLCSFMRKRFTLLHTLYKFGIRLIYDCYTPLILLPNPCKYLPFPFTLSFNHYLTSCFSRPTPRSTLLKILDKKEFLYVHSNPFRLKRVKVNGISILLTCINQVKNSSLYIKTISI